MDQLLAATRVCPICSSFEVREVFSDFNDNKQGVVNIKNFECPRCHSDWIVDFRDKMIIIVKQGKPANLTKTKKSVPLGDALYR